MSDQHTDKLANSEQDERVKEDLSGRDRLVSNVVFSWAAHFVFLIAGFIMPRMIDRRLGQELLGIWDFAWSLVSYFGLAQAEIGDSVNRYVSMYRATGNISSVNRTVSSACCILGIAGSLVLGLTITLSLLLPQLFGTRLGENATDARWVVFFLGASIVIQISFSAFAGVMTGCHRWELHNIIKSGWYAATVVAMILALLQGGSLPSLAVITFAGLVLAYTTRVLLAYQVCIGLRLRLSLVDWETIKKLFVYGGKSLVPNMSNLLLNQTASIMILAYLGPSMLAVYSRPHSIIRHIRTLVNKMAFVLVPTTSSLQSSNNLEGIRVLLTKSVRYSLYLVLPIVLVLVVFGDAILKLWMGPRYASGLVLAVLAAGYVTTLVQLPVLNTLAGLNAHGRAGIAQFIAALCSAGLIVLALGYLGLGLAGVAVAVTLPLTIMNLVYLPYLICRRVGLGVAEYFLTVGVGPAVHVLPFAICLVVARLVFQAEPLIGLVWGGAVGGAILWVLYWRYVLPNRIRSRLRRLAGMRGSIV